MKQLRRFAFESIACHVRLGVRRAQNSSITKLKPDMEFKALKVLLLLNTAKSFLKTPQSLIQNTHLSKFENNTANIEFGLEY
jgi:hypothetical protein